MFENGCKLDNRRVRTEGGGDCKLRREQGRKRRVGVGSSKLMSIEIKLR